MKKIALASAFFLFALSMLQAQSSGDGKGFRFGFQASPSWSWIRTSDKLIEGVSPNWGLKLGVMAENYFTPNYAIVSGLGFAFNQGGTIQNGYPKGVFWSKSELSSATLFDTLPKDAKLHYRVTYVELPVGLKMRGGSNEDSRIQFFAEAPVFTIGFMTKAIGDIRGTNTQNTDDEVIRDDVHGLSISWGLGAGIEYELAAGAKLVTGLFYQRQFTDLTGNKDTGVLADTGWKTEKSKASVGALTLRIGVFFGN